MSAKHSHINIRLPVKLKGELEDKAGIIPLSAVARQFLERWLAGEIEVQISRRPAPDETRAGEERDDRLAKR